MVASVAEVDCGMRPTVKFLETMTRRGERIGPLVFVAYGEKMEADARQHFAGTGVHVVQSQPIPWSADTDLTKW
jgi:hypothetical protein